jgi:predicted NBD/HSP70 family sugar kinase
MATSSVARQINEARILRVLLENGPLSRAEIARRLNLTKSGMTNVIADLLTDKLIVEADSAVARGRVGRPGTDVDLNPDGAYALGAEVVVGSISMLALDLRGQIVGGQAVTRSVDTTSAEITLGNLKRMVGEFVKEKLPQDASISGLCLAIPGFVTRDGHVAHAQKLGWRDVPVQRLLSEHVAWSVAVENDANVSAFAEWYMAAPVDRHDLLLISLSTGAGAGLISQGRIVRGYNGMAGEIGQMVLDDQASGGFDRIPMTWQGAIGSDAVVEAYSRRRGCLADLEDLTRAVQQRQADAVGIAEQWAYWVSRGLTSMIYAHDPERIVVGGELAPLFELVRGKVEGEIRSRLAAGFPAPSLRTSGLGPHIASLGAAALVHSTFIRSDYHSDATALP